MAVTAVELGASTENPVTSFTMSLMTGRDEIPPENGGRLPVAGDVVILEVRRPLSPVTVPGWTAADGRLFWKMIGPREPDPVFYSSEGAVEWEIRGYAVAGETIAPLDGSGSSAAPAS